MRPSGMNFAQADSMRGTSSVDALRPEVLHKEDGKYLFRIKNSYFPILITL